MSGRTILWYCCVILVASVAIVAIVLACIAFSDAQARRPHRSMERGNIVARGELCADGDVHTKRNLRVDGDTQLRGKARMAHAALRSVAFDDVVCVTDAGPVEMSAAHSVYRVDTSGPAAVVPFYLPVVTDAPLHVYEVMVSQLGRNSKVEFYVAPGNALSTAGSASDANPAYSMPANPGQPDHVLLFNDGLSTWFAVAHSPTIPTTTTTATTTTPFPSSITLKHHSSKTSAAAGPWGSPTASPPSAFPTTFPTTSPRRFGPRTAGTAGTPETLRALGDE